MKGIDVAADQEPSGAEPKNLLTLGLLVIIVLMAAFAVFGDRGALRIVQAHKQKQALEQQLAELQQEQKDLKAEIERLNNDKDYWEQLARNRLGMVREGELIYHIPDSPEDKPTTEPDKE